jgi:hypothetical protein
MHCKSSIIKKKESFQPFKSVSSLEGLLEKCRGRRLIHKWRNTSTPDWPPPSRI